jgi:hypothetical protein
LRFCERESEKKTGALPTLTSGFVANCKSGERKKHDEWWRRKNLPFRSRIASGLRTTRSLSLVGEKKEENPQATPFRTRIASTTNSVELYRLSVDVG